MSETGLLPAYLIVGTDGVKRDHAVSRMKARLEKSGMVEFNLDERDMTKDPDIESIIGSLNTFPMGSEFRLVILDGCSKLAKAVSEPLVEYLASPSPTTVCLVIADSLAKNTRLYKAIAKIDAALRHAIRERSVRGAAEGGLPLTTVIVSQRVSTVRDADMICVLDHGSVAGLGAHDELYASCQLYREICQSQLRREELEGQQGSAASALAPSPVPASGAACAPAFTCAKEGC